MKKARWIIERRREALVLGDFEIVVQGNDYHGWELICEGLDISNCDLSSKHFADAREEALGIVAEEAQALVERYRNLRERALEVLNGEAAQEAVSGS